MSFGLPYMPGALGGGGDAGHRYWRLLANDISWNVAAGNYNLAAHTIAFFESTDGSGTDLCLSKTAAASSIFSATYNAAKANDNNDTTHWSTQNSLGTAGWWLIDLGVGGEKTISSVKIRAFTTASHPYMGKSMLLQYSDDNTNWTTKSTFSTTDTSTTTTVTYSNL